MMPAIEFACPFYFVSFVFVFIACLSASSCVLSLYPPTIIDTSPLLLALSQHTHTPRSLFLCLALSPRSRCRSWACTSDVTTPCFSYNLLSPPTALTSAAAAASPPAPPARSRGPFHSRPAATAAAGRSSRTGAAVAVGAAAGARGSGGSPTIHPCYQRPHRHSCCCRWPTRPPR